MDHSVVCRADGAYRRVWATRVREAIVSAGSRYNCSRGLRLSVTAGLDGPYATADDERGEVGWKLCDLNPSGIFYTEQENQNKSLSGICVPHRIE